MPKLSEAVIPLQAAKIDSLQIRLEEFLLLQILAMHVLADGLKRALAAQLRGRDRQGG